MICEACPAGIQAGAYVTVASRRITPGMVFIAFHSRQTAAAPSNDTLDRFGKTREFRFSAVRVEKARA